MRKRTPLLEWQFAENQEGRGGAPWPPASDTAPSTPADQTHPHRRYLWGGLLALLLLLASAGGWLWHTAQAGLDQIEGELSSTVQLELTSATSLAAPTAASWALDTNNQTNTPWQAQLARERENSHSALPSDLLDTQQNATVQIVNLQNNLVVANVVTAATAATQSYRQTRFYRYTEGTWLRIQPDANLWGSPRRLESTYFIFHFRQNDAKVVAAVAPQIDTLYSELLHNFGLTANLEKLAIEVTVERITGVIPTPSWDRKPLLVPSPALYLAPVELSDAAILAQSIALPLVHYLGGRTIKEHAIPLRWQPLLLGLQLQQLWDLEMPLAQWRHDIVRWLFSSVPGAGSEQASLLPYHDYTELCAMHRLWLWPSLIGIPLTCSPSDPGTWSKERRKIHAPRTHLDQLGMPLTEVGYLYDIEDNYLSGSTRTVAVATLLDYAVTAYGYEQLPVLLAGLAQHKKWDTLIPAVYGVSPAEFEQGWQVYLSQEYGVLPSLLER